MKKQVVWLIILSTSLLAVVLGLLLQWPDNAIRLAGGLTLVSICLESYYTVRVIKKQ